MRELQFIDPSLVPFMSPFQGQILIKGQDEGGKWNVYLEASNEGLDQDQEVILQKALNEAAPYYLSHGVLSWDHKHKHTGNPEFIIGEPLDVAFRKDGRTLVKGFLYKENEIAKSVWKNIISGARLGASIGGGILKKSAERGAGLISRIIWNETAITHKPVNDGTLGNVSLVPFEEFAKALLTMEAPGEVQDTDDFWKALTAGSGVNAANYSGGRALSGESLDNEVADLTFGSRDVPEVPYEEGRRYFDGLLAGLSKGKIASLNDVVSYTQDQGYSDSVAATLIDFVARKIPKLRR
jgi:hypothetical protein